MELGSARTVFEDTAVARIQITFDRQAFCENDVVLRQLNMEVADRIASFLDDRPAVDRKRIGTSTPSAQIA